MMNLPASLNLRPFLFAAALILACQPAFAEKRVALVLGNSAYQNVAPLPNPVNDGAVIAEKLKQAGFDVVDFRHDLAAADTRRALREFADTARDADIAVVYYAGHGMEVDGTNYLIPIDAKLERDYDVYDEALSLDRVLVAVEPARQLRLVILDACRDNPFAKTMKRSMASRSIGRGLARIEPTNPNTLIAYSAKAGSTALDGTAGNSPFTLALARHLTTPGLDVRKAFGFVRDDVLKTTGNRQEPFVYGSLGGDDVPLVAARSVTTPAPAPASNPQADARADYELALQIGNKDALNAFLARYPDGYYADLARIKLANMVTADKTPDTRVATPNAAAEKPAVAPAEMAAPRPNVAALAPAAPSSAELIKSEQTELRRVGCLAGDANGEWNAASQRSLALFNKHAGTKFDVKLASIDALDAIKLKSSRVCPLVCQHGFKADGDRCGKITCAEGSFLNDDNDCEKRRARTPAARREDNDRPGRGAPSERPRAQAAVPAKPQASGQVVCDDHLCHAVKRGCHVEFRTSEQGGSRMGGGSNVEICN